MILSKFLSKLLLEIMVDDVEIPIVRTIFVPAIAKSVCHFGMLWEIGQLFVTSEMLL